MPVFSGVEAAREISRSLPELPILFLSMHASKQLVAEAKKIGVQGFVTKSQAASTLLEAVDLLLKKETCYADVV
jgi:DNA-binding NarL/FixJ family response regulator